MERNRRPGNGSTRLAPYRSLNRSQGFLGRCVLVETEEKNRKKEKKDLKTKSPRNCPGDALHENTLTMKKYNPELIFSPPCGC